MEEVSSNLDSEIRNILKFSINPPNNTHFFRKELIWISHTVFIDVSEVIRDNTHMTSMKIVQFSRPLSPFVYLLPKIFCVLDLERPILNEPPSSPNDNQSVKRKHNPRMTIICYQVLSSSWL